MAVQNEIKEQERYVNVTPYPGTNRELFAGEFANEQKIEGRKPARWLLVPDGKGGYRLPTDEEMNAILRRYMRNIEGRK